MYHDKLKRYLDIAVAVFGLILLSPFFLLPQMTQIFADFLAALLSFAGIFTDSTDFHRFL